MRTKTYCGWLCRVFLILTLLNAGCTKVGPNFLRPTGNVTKDWLEAGDKRVKQESKADKEWWKVFNDPVLTRLIDLAYANNLSLQLAGVRVLTARAQLAITVGNLYPQTQDLNGLVQYNRGSQRSASVVQGAIPGLGSASGFNEFAFNQSQLGIQANWEIDFWGKFRRAIESADATLLSSIADYDNTLVTLTGDVATNYVQIRTLQERLKIARDNVDIQKESLNIAEIRFHGGTTTQRDVEQAKTVLASTQATIPQLDAQLRQAQNNLCVLLGMPPNDLNELLDGNSGIPSPPPEVAVGIPADLLQRRPDIRSVEAQAAAQCAKIGVAKADLFPSFSLLGTFGILSTDKGSFNLSDMFQWGSRTATFGPTLQWNVLNYGRITNNVRLQDAQFQQLLITYQNTVLQAQQDVENSLIAFLRAQERAVFLTDSAEAATRSLNLAVLQYRQGIADFTTVLTAQQSLLQQQDTLASTLGEISTDLVGTYRALGGGWEMREGKDFVPAPTRKVMAERTNWGGLLDPAALKPVAPEHRDDLIRAPDW